MRRRGRWTATVSSPPSTSRASAFIGRPATAATDKDCLSIPSGRRPFPKGNGRRPDGIVGRAAGRLPFPTSPCTPPPNPLHCVFGYRLPGQEGAPSEMPKDVGRQYDPTNPLIVQGDRSVLVEVDNPRYAEARDALAPFAELEKSPEHIHTYRLTPLSLWNAAAAGMTADAMIDVLRQLQQVPAAVQPRRRHRRSRSAATAGSSSERLAEPGDERLPRCVWSATTAAAGRAGPPAEGARLPRRPARRRPASSSSRPSRRAQAGADRRRLPGRGPGRLHRRGGPADPPAHGRALRPAVPRPRLPARGGRHLLRRRRRARRQRRHRAALRRRQDHRRHRRHGPDAAHHPGADHQHHRRQAVAPRDPRQDRPRPRSRSPSTPARPRRSPR